jgi:teichuronic acid biosynthesis glycosyltransferase TuaC
MDAPIRVLMLTAGWPQPGQPQTTHFVKRQAEFLQRAGVLVDVFHFRGAKNPWNYAKAWLAVRPRLRSGRYDLVHAQFGQSGVLALPKRLPLVVTLRGSDILGIVGKDGRYTLAGRISQFVARLAIRRADAVVVVSEHMKAYFDTAAPVTVLPSGLDFELFRCMPRDEARRQLGWPLDKRLVLFAGNPEQPRKRYALANAAMDLLNRTLPAELVVAWGVPHAQIPVYMNACDAFVFTSMQEGSPNVVKEALACDLPVVSVPIGDVAERLRGIEGCALCSDERPETIAAALERVLRRGKRVAGRVAVAPLAEEAITERLIGVYRTAMGRAAHPASSHPTEAVAAGAATAASPER